MTKSYKNNNEGLVGELKQKIEMLENVVEDKDSQIKAMLETLDEKEKEIEELHNESPP